MPKTTVEAVVRLVVTGVAMIKELWKATR